MNSKKIWILLIIMFFLAGVAGSYFFMHKFNVSEKQPLDRSSQNFPATPEDLSVLRIYYPSGNRLEMVEKRLPRRTNNTAIAEAVLEQLFKMNGTDGLSNIPQNIKLLGIYKDQSQILYVDLSDEIRSNFHGDILSEYLLLKSIYETLVSNIQDFQDVKILLEGKEIETLGGHFYLKYPLKNLVSSEFQGGNKVSNE